MLSVVLGERYDAAKPGRTTIYDAITALYSALPRGALLKQRITAALSRCVDRPGRESKATTALVRTFAHLCSASSGLGHDASRQSGRMLGATDERPDQPGRSGMGRLHSVRSAITGSIRVARRAGKNEAHSATSSNVTDGAR